jgi:hypothetical protein
MTTGDTAWSWLGAVPGCRNDYRIGSVERHRAGGLQIEEREAGEEFVARDEIEQRAQRRTDRLGPISLRFECLGGGEEALGRGYVVGGKEGLALVAEVRQLSPAARAVGWLVPVELGPGSLGRLDTRNRRCRGRPLDDLALTRLIAECPVDQLWNEAWEPLLFSGPQVAVDDPPDTRSNRKNRHRGHPLR